jgi:hypothetical protein
VSSKVPFHISTDNQSLSLLPDQSIDTQIIMTAEAFWRLEEQADQFRHENLQTKVWKKWHEIASKQTFERERKLVRSNLH